MTRLIFVYALDSGLVNEVVNYAHKVFSPSTYACNLCALTNNLLGTKREWAQFIRDLGTPAEFLHRDVFASRYPAAKADSPAVFSSKDNGQPEILITGAEMQGLRELPALISLVRERVDGLRVAA